MENYRALIFLKEEHLPTLKHNILINPIESKCHKVYNNYYPHNPLCHSPHCKQNRHCDYCKEPHDNWRKLHNTSTYIALQQQYQRTLKSAHRTAEAE